MLGRLREKDIVEVINKSGDFRSLVFKYKELSLEDIKKLRGSVENILSNSSESPPEILNEELDDLSFFMNQYVKLTAEDEIFREFDKGLKYLGSTFIEDELQDDIKDIMVKLREAGLQIWMVTGDKKEILG